MVDNNWQPQIAAFICQWCTYAGADLAGTGRMKYDPNVRIIKVPCSGRIDPLFLVKALEQGADGVLVSGCHPGDCHYVTGNMLARRRFTAFRELLNFLGLQPERLQFSWVSAAEAVKWTEVVGAVTAEIRQLGPSKYAQGPGAEDGNGTEPSFPELPAIPQLATQDQQIIETAIQDIARQLLASNEVDVIVGYGQGTLPGTTTPLFVSSPEQVAQLVWNQHCRNNLAVYLTRDLVRQMGRVGIVAKGCDARALVGLLQEHQLRRDEVTIIGTPCSGMMDGIVETGNGKLAAKCLACDVQTPFVYDHLVAGQAAQNDSEISDPRDVEIAALDALTPDQRRIYWQKQFSDCIRCYACRAVCPLCYCDTCIADKTQPQWIPPAFDDKGNLSWNIFRAFHLVGRCTGCDECTRACPSHIRLDLINRKLALIIQEQYDYRPGYDAQVPPPLTTFRPEDRAEFIR